MAQENEEFVKVPKVMYEQLERRSQRLSEIEKAMFNARRALENYNINTVLTLPPSGADASKVNEAVRELVRLAKG